MAQFTLHNVLDQLQDVKESGGKYTALCPAHDDHNPSLSITPTDDKILLNCFAGCTYEAIIAALGVARNARPQSNATGTAKKPRGKPVKIYDYTDANGYVVHQTERYEPKAFSQRRPDPAKPGAYLWNLNGITPVLYRLPEVIQAVTAGSTILVCEGEKDADNRSAATRPEGLSQLLRGAGLHKA